MENRIFAERVSAVCGRVIKMNDLNDRVWVQKYPNNFNIQLSFDLRPWAWILKQAEIVDLNTGRWFILFEMIDGRFLLQENTEIDGPEGIVDLCYSKTIVGCLNELTRQLND